MMIWVPMLKQSWPICLLPMNELARRLGGTSLHVNVADPGIASGTDMAKKSIGSRRLTDRLKILIGSRVFTAKRVVGTSCSTAKASKRCTPSREEAGTQTCREEKVF